MLQIIHRYWKSLCGILVIAALCLVMSDFGVGFFADKGGRGSSNHAIKVNDRVVTHREFYRERRQEEQRYRNMFGENFDRLAGSLLGNLSQQVVDRLLSDLLLEGFAASRDLVVGPNEVARLIRNELFRDGFNREQYAFFLRSLGMTATDFEAQLQSEALRAKLLWLLSDASLPSDREALALKKIKTTEYDVSFAVIDPARFEKAIAIPSEQELLEYYHQHAFSYELPARVKYNYTVIRPQDYRERVEIFPEDLELYYADNQARFMSPEVLRARHIQVNYASDSDPKKMVEKQELASVIHQRALSGEDFAALALEYSDDIVSKGLGGDLGLIQRGQRTAEFDAAVFSHRAQGVLPLISTDYGFHIVEITNYQPSAPRAFSEVRAEIEGLIREIEAPAYASLYAREFYEGWVKSARSLSEFGNESEIKVVNGQSLLDASKDPISLQGLTRRVLNSAGMERQLIELGDLIVLAEVIEHREAAVPEFSEIKEKVLSDFKTTAAVRLANEKANNLLKEAIEAGGLKVLPESDWAQISSLTQVTPSTRIQEGPLADAAIRQAVFSRLSPGIIPQTFEIDGKLYLAEVGGLDSPDVIDSLPELADYRREEAIESAQTILTSLINSLKVRSKIDVDPTLLISERY